MSGPSALSPLKQAFLALQASQNRVAELEAARSEPIAIVGMACRFPGGVDSSEDFWALLRNVRSAIAPKNLERWRECGAAPATTSETEALRWGALLDRVDEFDPQFFGISPREAISMDPQQRLLLETSWHALEDAAIAPDTTFGSSTGVYFGLSASDYTQLQLASLAQDAMEPHFASGSGHSVASGRISHTLGWHGPSVSIDTACSSSLVAVHLACKALESGDCTMALAGGVNLILSPESSIAFSRAGMLSSSGQVRSFGMGDGFVRGEGCGVVVLKRLSAAQRDHDRVLGVILGSSVNHDGPGSGLTVPNGQAQAMLLRAALASAGIAPAAVGYVEAHGTGTRLGDPIEAEALGEVFTGPRDAPLQIGSVKTNLGHLEAAAGIAGLIKLVLSLGHGEIPAQVQDSPLSEHVRWNELPLDVATRHRTWYPIAGRRIGGVSAFGFSGTNAHVLVEEYPREVQQNAKQDDEGDVLVLSAKSEAALDRMVERYIVHLASHPEQRWGDVCYTAAVGRSHFKHRIAIVAENLNDGLELLRTYAREHTSQGTEHGQIQIGHRPRAAVLCGSEGVTELSPDTRVNRARALGGAYVAGRDVDWAAWNVGRARRRIALPGYSFERQRHWITPSVKQPSHGPAQSIARATGHPLLGRQLQLAGDGKRYEQPLRLESDHDLSWLREHRIQGHVLMPATALLEILLAAGDRLAGHGEPQLEDVVFAAPMLLDGNRLMQVAVDSESDTEARFRSKVRVYSIAASDVETVEPDWMLHAEGYVRHHAVTATANQALEVDSPSLEELGDRCSEIIEAEPFYASMRARGADFGPRFQRVERIWRRPGEALGQVRIEHLGTRLHPASFDACLQVAAAAMPSRPEDEESPAMLPFHVTRLHLLSSPVPHETCFVHAVTLPSANPKHTRFQITLFAPIPEHTPIATLTLEFAQQPTRGNSNQQHTMDDWLYRLRWVLAALEPTASPETGEWLVILSKDSPDDAVEDHLTQHLQSVGHSLASLRLGDHDLESSLATSISDRIRGIVYLHTSRNPAPDSALDFTSQTRTQVEELLSLVRELLRRGSSPPTLYVVTRNACPVLASTETIDPLESILSGLAATIPTEQASLRCVRLDIAAEEIELSASQIVDELLSSPAESCVAFRNGLRYVQRLERFSPSDKALPVELKFNPAEGLHGLQYERQDRHHPGPMEVKIEVRASALNFHDVLCALGVLSDSEALGVECSGVVSAIGAGVVEHKPGDEVIALTAGTFADYAVAPQSLTVPKPASLSYAEAASLPVAYLTADFCLNDIAHLHAGQSVLIHAASGGVGLAAVHLCRRAGAKIFATAGSERKRAYLRSLGVEHAMDSRSNAFAAEIMSRTAGRGVDIVLNSLAGELTDAGLSITAPSGCFIDIGATDIRDASEIAATYPGVNYHSVDLSRELRDHPQRMKDRLRAILAEVEAGHLLLLPLEQFPFTKTIEAFQRMAAAKHLGKLVLTRDATHSTRAKIRIDAEDAYIVTGGMRGLGLEAVKWLSASGAGRVIVVGRQQPSPQTTQIFAQLHKTRTHIVIVQGDIAEYGIATEAVDLAGPGLKGIIHCAAVLDDAPIEQQSWERFSRVLRPKADAAWLLHTLTKSRTLDFFVMYSSWASIAGSPGAANYCAANMFLDALAHHRRSLGLPATSINWGAWAETGMAASPSGLATSRNGFRAFSSEAGTAALAFAIYQCDEAQLAIADVNWPSARLLLKQHQRSSVFADVLISEDRATRLKIRPAPRPAPSATTALFGAVRSAPPPDRRRILARQITGIVAKTLSLPAGETIDALQPLEEVGLDSILAVELRTEIARVTEIPLPVGLLFDYPTIASLTDHILEFIEAKTELPLSESSTPRPPTLLDRIEELSDDEVDRLIQQRASDEKDAIKRR